MWGQNGAPSQPWSSILSRALVVIGSNFLPAQLVSLMKHVLWRIVDDSVILSRKLSVLVRLQGGHLEDVPKSDNNMGISRRRHDVERSREGSSVARLTLVARVHHVPSHRRAAGAQWCSCGPDPGRYPPLPPGPPSSAGCPQGHLEASSPQTKTAASPAVASEQRQHPADHCGCCGEPSPSTAHSRTPSWPCPRGTGILLTRSHPPWGEALSDGRSVAMPGLSSCGGSSASPSAWSFLHPHPLSRAHAAVSTQTHLRNSFRSQSKVLFTGKPQRPQGPGSQGWVK